MADATRGAEGANTGTGISPDTYASWDREKRLRFKEKHPAEFTALSRGETINGLTF